MGFFDALEPDRWEPSKKIKMDSTTWVIVAILFVLMCIGIVWVFSKKSDVSNPPSQVVPTEQTTK